jgi:hypothetical protein
MTKKPASEYENSTKVTAPEPEPLDTRAEDNDDRVNALERQVAALHALLSGNQLAKSSASSLDATLVEQQNERIGELQRLVGDLEQQMMAAQVAAARDEQFNSAVRSVERAAAALQRNLATTTTGAIPPEPAPSKDCDCDRASCNCVSCDCCMFEVWMTHVRVDQMQNPLIDVVPPSADSNVLPTGMMEVWMFASIDAVHNRGACIPSPSPTSYIPLQKQIFEAVGPWEDARYCVGSVAVKKGTSVTVPLSLTAVEREDAAERLQPGNRDEWGSATQATAAFLTIPRSRYQ